MCNGEVGIFPSYRIAPRRRFENERNRFLANGFVPSTKWNYDSPIIPKVSASYIDGVSQISEIATRSIFPFSGLWGSRPSHYCHKKRIVHRRRFQMSEIATRPPALFSCHLEFRPTLHPVIINGVFQICEIAPGQALRFLANGISTDSLPPEEIRHT